MESKDNYGRLEEKLDRLSDALAAIDKKIDVHAAKEEPFQTEVREKYDALNKKLDDHLAEHLAMKRSAVKTTISVVKVLAGWVAAGVVYAWHWFQTIETITYKR